ncbi:MAG: RecQ family ATP-dependent DNA helicase, partial [Verrucomicrobiota bacterium]
MSLEPTAALEKHFGFREFREGQEDIVHALVQGRDAMVVMPTGGGKSLCYQLPALIKDGVTLIISPLIALMKDQVDALEARGLPAAMINSTLSLTEQKERMHRLRQGEIKLLYVSPERFRAAGFRDALKEVEVSLFAVDEAHCLSQWGHDFRPDYMRLGQTLEELGRPQVAAFTATATPTVRKDIQETLKLRDPFISVTGFERPNLSLRVRKVEGNREKQHLLEKVVKQWKTGIVYCSTRKRVEEVSQKLIDAGLPVIGYHGGMPDEQRKSAQNAFISGRVDIVVATNAFGMGIDRSDVRFVVHYELPGSIEAYYQEAGRAGRDREQAVCELFFNYADTRTQEFFIEGANPDPVLIRNIYSTLLCRADDEHQVVASISDIADWADADNSMSVSSALATLGRAGYLTRFDVPGQRTRGTRILKPDVSGFDLQLDEESLLAKEKSDREKLKDMTRFCYDDRCRQQWILRYFGEAAPETCGSCDVCLEDSAGEKRAPMDDEKLLVRKALSGVARMSSRTPGGTWRGRFGRGRIIGMLTGSQAQEIQQHRLDQLPTYGILKEVGTKYLHALFNELERAGLLKTETDREYPLVTLTDRGADVMKDESTFTLAWPITPKSSALKERKPSKSGSKGSEPPTLTDKGFDPDLYDKLKQKRYELAQAEGGKPPFVIFGNSTLEALARYQPSTMDEGMSIKGIGEVKAERYLE